MENYWKEIPLLFQYTQALMSILGLIAGFGFTGFQYIKSPIIFFLGEIMVIGSVLYLVYTLKIYIAGQPISTENLINGYQEKTRQIKKALQEKNIDKINEFSKEFRKNINDISEGPKVQTARILNNNIEVAFLFSVLSIFSIFLSFIYIDSFIFFKKRIASFLFICK